MTEHVIKLPDVGEGVAEAELVEWQVKVGDLVREDTILAAVMTDKATVEIPSPVDGEVTWLGAEVGDTVAVGSPIVRIAVAGGSTKKDASTEKAAPGDKVADKDTPTPHPSPEGGGEMARVAAASKGAAGGSKASTATAPAEEPASAGDSESPSP